MKNKIRYVANNTYSKRDKYGNCYWLSAVTSTKTGKTISFLTPHESNTTALMRTFLEWGEFLVFSNEISIRDFNSLVKKVKRYNSCMDELISDEIKKLENE